MIVPPKYIQLFLDTTVRGSVPCTCGRRPTLRHATFYQLNDGMWNVDKEQKQETLPMLPTRCQTSISRRSNLCFHSGIRGTNANHTFHCPGTVRTIPTKLSTIVALLLQEKHQFPGLNNDIGTPPKVHKSVCEHFRIEPTSRLMTLCNVLIEFDLPKLWTTLAISGGKSVFQIIESVLIEKAAEEVRSAMPKVTPLLAKKIVKLRLLGTNIDALDEGINPFAFTLKEYLMGRFCVPKPILLKTPAMSKTA